MHRCWRGKQLNRWNVCMSSAMLWLFPDMQAGRQHVRRLGVWSTNKHTYPHMEVFRYRLYT